jgi:hypothetical protein
MVGTADTLDLDAEEWVGLASEVAVDAVAVAIVVAEYVEASEFCQTQHACRILSLARLLWSVGPGSDRLARVAGSSEC